MSEILTVFPKRTDGPAIGITYRTRAQLNAIAADSNEPGINTGTASDRIPHTLSDSLRPGRSYTYIIAPPLDLEVITPVYSSGYRFS